MKIGHNYSIFGGNFTFEYSLHSIPCLSIKVEFHGKKFFLSGDTLYDPEQLHKMY